METVASREGPISPATVFHQMTTEGGVPLRTAHRIQIHESLTTFDLRRVRQVELPATNYKKTGLIIGLAVDVGLLLYGFTVWSELHDFDLDIY